MDDKLLLNISEDKESEKKKLNFSFDFNDYKSVLYTALFYSFGLFVGAYFYKITQFESLNNMLAPKNDDFLNLFIENFCLYFSIFVLVVFLGFCLIGFPIINIIPTVIGIFTGIKISYFLICYAAKGVGYCLIMIAPFAALFLTVIAFTIEISTELSKNLMLLTKQDDVEKGDIDIKKQVKKYLIFSLVILAVSAINSIMTCLLYSVVTI